MTRSSRRSTPTMRVDSCCSCGTSPDPASSSWSTPPPGSARECPASPGWWPPHPCSAATADPCCSASRARCVRASCGCSTPRARSGRPSRMSPRCPRTSSSSRPSSGSADGTASSSPAGSTAPRVPKTAAGRGHPQPARRPRVAGAPGVRAAASGDRGRGHHRIRPQHPGLLGLRSRFRARRRRRPPPARVRRRAGRSRVPGRAGHRGGGSDRRHGALLWRLPDACVAGLLTRRVRGGHRHLRHVRPRHLLPRHRAVDRSGRRVEVRAPRARPRPARAHLADVPGRRHRSCPCSSRTASTTRTCRSARRTRSSPRSTIAAVRSNTSSSRARATSTAGRRAGRCSSRPWCASSARTSPPTPTTDQPRPRRSDRARMDPMAERTDLAVARRRPERDNLP